MNVFKDEQELETFLLFAFRYCLTRRSYAVRMCIDFLRRYWPLASKRLKTVVKHDIIDAHEFNNLIEPEWLVFRGEIDEEEKER